MPFSLPVLFAHFLCPNVTCCHCLLLSLSVSVPVSFPDTPWCALFSQFYYLASVRMRDLCERLKLLDDVRETIWTVFEYVIVHHVTVMQGRHLDQLIMSSIFIVCKVSAQGVRFVCFARFRCVIPHQLS